MNVSLEALAVLACLSIGPAGGAPAAGAPWLDNERQFKSDDPKINFRRSDHFRIGWGQGAAANKDENADFGAVTEQLAQGNLQMLEHVWHRYHDPEPLGIGFHAPGESSQPKTRDGKFYRANLYMNNTGIWAGGAWGSNDDWGLPIFALPPTYLAFDPPSGATPHEYGHTTLINAGGFNDTPYDGMWHEATANWLQLQFLNAYSGPGGVGVQPYLSMPHGRNYYDAWQIYEYLAEDPRYGYPFINRLWTQANGNKARGGEYIFDAMVRLDTSGSPDPYNAIKDAIGGTAAHNVMWDYRRQPFFQKQSARTMDPFMEMYRRAYTELTRRQGDTTWYRVPFSEAPMQGGYNVVPIALNGKEGGGYKVSINFKPLWDATRGSDWRATFVAVNDAGESRYSTMWNGGVNSITLAADENQLFLAVAATPDFMGFEGFSHPLISDLPLQPQAYEIEFLNTKAGPYETKPARPAGVTGKPHSNGGGFVADTAKVDATAYVGPDAMVLGQAQVLGNARIEDRAVVMGNAVVKDDAIVSGYALVRDNAQVSGHGRVRDWATVQGRWTVSEYGRALEHAFLLDRGELTGHGTIKGNVPDYGGAKTSGYAIKEGDCANGVPISKQVLMCWVWGADQAYADAQPDTGGLYCDFTFARQSPIYALDKFGVMHGYLMGAPKSVALAEKALPGALQLNGKDQYVELKRDVADFTDTTIAVWVKWAGGAADQRLLYLGDGAGKYAYLTPKDPDTGKLRFVISTNGVGGEQSLDAPGPLQPGTWTHVAVTLKGDTGTLYVDGNPVATNNALTHNPDMVLGPNVLNGKDNTFLGRGPEGQYFSGLVSDFRVYVQPQGDGVIAAAAALLPDRNASPVAPVVTATRKLSTPGFLLKPTVAGADAVVMSAPRPGKDAKGVEYAFVCTGGGGHNSGWTSSTRFTDCVLTPGQTYSYACKVRDGSGNETPLSAPVKVTIPKPAVPDGAFESEPRGISGTSIRMTARKAPASAGAVEYQFTRDDGHTSGWQSSRTWTDSGLAAGSTHAYRVQARNAWGTVGKASSGKSAVARDDTPPARYKVGEWRTLPYSTLTNTISMKAMSVTGENDSPRIEPDPVEYYFHCVSGNGPDSGWIHTATWQSAPVPDGTYRYEFKMRDISPQHNETPYSSVETATVSTTTGYHDYPLGQVARQAEGVLVAFKGKVTAVEPKAYTVSADGASVKVGTQAVAGATDAALKDRDVTVKGCVWTRDGEKRVLWAEVK
ncbi:MAG TPA: DUF6055 domain-containing protein [Armatimonadota bacterium]|jgi:hypothetical protein